MKYTGERPSASVAQARRAIEAYPDFRAVGYGRWACVLKSTGAIVGFCGLKYLPDFDEVDIGFRFLPSTFHEEVARSQAPTLSIVPSGLQPILSTKLPSALLQVRH